MKFQRLSIKSWWVGLAAICLLGAPISAALAQPAQTAQSIMVSVTPDNTSYEIEGTVTWTYQRNTCAVGEYTANSGVWNNLTPTCTGGGPGGVNCLAANQPAVPSAPAIPTTGPNSIANHAQDDRCAFFCGGNVPGWNYTQTRTVNGRNGFGNWTFTYDYTTTGAGVVLPNTCWNSVETGGTVDIGFDGFVCSESFQKQSTRNKYSFTLLGPEGSRVYNVQVALQKFDGTNWETVEGPTPVAETDLVTGQLPVASASENFSYFGNGGVFGNAAVFAFLHAQSGKAANTVHEILNGFSDGAIADNFAGNNNDLAAGNVHVAEFTGEWLGLTEPGSYRTMVTGTLKGNTGGAAGPGFAVTSDVQVIGGCNCGS